MRRRNEFLNRCLHEDLEGALFYKMAAVRRTHMDMCFYNGTPNVLVKSLVELGENTIDFISFTGREGIYRMNSQKKDHVYSV
jgi:hypothetical protein